MSMVKLLLGSIILISVVHAGSIPVATSITFEPFVKLIPGLNDDLEEMVYEYFPSGFYDKNDTAFYYLENAETNIEEILQIILTAALKRHKENPLAWYLVLHLTKNGKCTKTAFDFLSKDNKNRIKEAKLPKSLKKNSEIDIASTEDNNLRDLESDDDNIGDNKNGNGQVVNEEKEEFWKKFEQIWAHRQKVKRRKNEKYEVDVEENYGAEEVKGNGGEISQ